MSELDDILDGDDAIDIDFSGSKDSDFSDIPADVYNVEVTKVEAGKGVVSKKGTPKIILTFTILDGEFKGRKLFMHPVLKDPGLWKTRKTLKALGQTVEGDVIRVSKSGLLGTKVRGEVTEESSEFSSIENITPALPGSLGDL